MGSLYCNFISFTYSAQNILVKMTILSILDYCASKNLLSNPDTIYHTAIFVWTLIAVTYNSLVNWPSLYTRRQFHWYQYIYKLSLAKPYHISAHSSVLPAIIRIYFLANSLVWSFLKFAPPLAINHHSLLLLVSGTIYKRLWNSTSFFCYDKNVL